MTMHNTEVDETTADAVRAAVEALNTTVLKAYTDGLDVAIILNGVQHVARATFLPLVSVHVARPV